MPALSSGAGASATLTPKTRSPRCSAVCTLRGVYSPWSRISTTWPRIFATREAVDGHRRRLAQPDVSETRLRHVDPHPELARLEQRRHRLVGGHQVAGPQVERLDRSVHRRPDHRFLALALQIGEPCLRLGQGGAGGVDVFGARAALELAVGLARGGLGDHGAVVVAAPHHAITVEALEALAVDLGGLPLDPRPPDLLLARAAHRALQPGPGLRHARLLLPDLVIEEIGLEGDQDLAGGHRRALHGVDARHPAAGERADRDQIGLHRAVDERRLAALIGAPRAPAEDARDAGHRHGEDSSQRQRLAFHRLFLRRGGRSAPRVQMSISESR